VRIAIGSLRQETNTFVPFKTTVETFEAFYLRRGDELRHGYGEARVEVPAFFSVLRESNIEPVPLLAAHAGANGPVTRQAFDALLGEMLDRLTRAGRVDGVLLALHGAMVVEDQEDAEAEIVRRVRAVVGPGVPIGASLDLHGHITAAMLQPDVFYIGYREYPHIDMWETGERVARPEPPRRSAGQADDENHHDAVFQQPSHGRSSARSVRGNGLSDKTLVAARSSRSCERERQRLPRPTSAKRRPSSSVAATEGKQGRPLPA